MSEPTADEMLDWLSGKMKLGCSHVVREADVTFDLTEKEHEAWLSGSWSDLRQAITAAIDAEKEPR